MAKIKEYLAMVDEYLDDLEKVLRDVKSREDFSKNPRLYYSTLHLLQLSIQCLIDMASRLVSLFQARKPKDYSDLAQILYEAGVLDEASRNSFRDMIKFRNLLVHVYAKVSPDMIFDIAKNRAKQDIQNIAGKIVEAATARGFDP